jgi:predicted ArsR family transcriptional regulator
VSDGYLPFGAPYSRTTDPVTSKLAAFEAASLKSRHERAILGVLHSSARPLAAEEIGDRIRMSSVQVCRRLAGLERAELVARTEDLHVNRTGRKAAKWRARV